VLHPTGEPADEWLAMLASHSPVTRMDALRLMAGNARDDPRYRVVLRDRREHDPSRRVRRYATDLLGPNFQHDGGDSPPDLDEIAWALAPTGKPADQWFTWLASGDAQGRSEAIRMIGRKARRDSRSLPVLLDRLEHDPSPHVRENAAEALGHLVTNEPARKALRETAAKDEDMQVRWAARYALKLTAPTGGAPT
jgi:HEAT repeat protein